MVAELYLFKGASWFRPSLGLDPWTGLAAGCTLFQVQETKPMADEMADEMAQAMENETAQDTENDMAQAMEQGQDSQPESEDGGAGAVYGIDVEVTAVLGSTHMKVSQILKMGRGAVVQLERMVGDEIELYANNQLIALGEVVVIDERLGISLTRIMKSGFTS